MAPLIVLVVVTLGARGVGALGVGFVDSWPAATALGLAAMFLMTAGAHWAPRRRAGLVAIVPPALRRPEVWVTVTGLLESMGAVGLLVPATRQAAAIGLTLLLIAMFPANVRAARGVDHPDAPRTPLLPRTLVQLVFVTACLLVAFG